MIKLITKEQFAACYEALALGSSFDTISKMLSLESEEFEYFIFNPVITQGFDAFTKE